MRTKRTAVVLLITCGFAFLAGAPALADEDENRIAETMLLYQRDSGGWPKNYDADVRLDDDAKAKVLAEKHRTDTTMDNGATHREVRALSRAYARTGDDRFNRAALRGIEFMLVAQYPNGGWPQRYPEPEGYAKHITFNDGAMIGVMTVLRDIAAAKAPYEFIGEETRTRAAEAVEKGIECILNCQIVVDGAKTVWCAQHDKQTLAPAKARSYELPSLSGGESTRIVQFLMQIEDPDRKIVEAIKSAVAWYQDAALHGIRLVRKEVPGAPEGFDRFVIEDLEAPPMWARFYQIGTNQPIFCSRDGVPRERLKEISHERRNGYSWLGYYAQDLLTEDYPAWRANVASEKHGAEIAPVDSIRHLVLDSRNIASTSNVKLVLGKIKKHLASPLFGEEKPWEQRFDNFYGSIVYEEDEKLYRLWWNPFIYDPDEGANERENGLEYAYSSDGIQWTKPNLGLVEYEGSTKNNLINRDSGHGHGIFKDPHESDPAKRYKMIAREDGVSVAYSADGLHWSDWIPAFKVKADTHNNAIWAPTLNKYVAISREFAWEGKARRRVVARSESDDFLSGWSNVEVVMDGGSKFQTYANAIFHHAGVYLGLVSVFDTSDGPTDNKVWTELAWSPDTRRWHRICEGTPFIPNSEDEGDPDWGTAYACLNPLFRDTDEVRIYYGGGDGKHNRYRDGYLMLATIKKDRWAGYEASGDGTIETVPVTCDGPDLYICADVKIGGSIRAEVIDVNGLSLKDCNPVTTDVSDGKITWSSKNLKDFIAPEIRLRFKLDKATLYSFFTR
jgi:PelA/Pel-15E family pectate lyase